MIFWRYLCSHWTYLLFNNSGGSRFKFGTSDHFLDTLQPVFDEIFGKVWNGNTQICCSITAHSWEGTVQSWYTCLHYFGKALQYCKVVLPHAESLPTVCIVELVRLRAILKNNDVDFQPEGFSLLFTHRILQLSVNFTTGPWPSQRNLDKISI